MIIRDYRNEDYGQVLALWEATGMGGPERGDDERVIRRTIRAGGKLLIMEDEVTHEVIGTSWLTCNGRRIYLHHFGIRPDRQGMGYSEFLLEGSLRFARRKGMQIKLEVHRTNARAINIYTRGGFKRLGDYDVYIIREAGADADEE
ncbi:MAG: GNAT family N-acetyltransferase [Bacteroidales bacterium]|nr:GNAT family N-acetyltransferase [Bacteroidales bacterium]